jgi:hypothetical protein
MFDSNIIVTSLRADRPMLETVQVVIVERANQKVARQLETTRRCAAPTCLPRTKHNRARVSEADERTEEYEKRKPAD